MMMQTEWQLDVEPQDLADACGLMALAEPGFERPFGSVDIACAYVRAKARDHRAIVRALGRPPGATFAAAVQLVAAVTGRELPKPAAPVVAPPAARRQPIASPAKPTATAAATVRATVPTARGPTRPLAAAKSEGRPGPERPLPPLPRAPELLGRGVALHDLQGWTARCGALLAQHAADGIQRAAWDAQLAEVARWVTSGDRFAGGPAPAGVSWATS